MNEIKLIIVEDEPIVAMDLKSQLEKLNFQVVEIFESGEEVLDFLKGAECDLILMDIQLQGALDGIDTAHEINRKSDVPILFLTANTDQGTFDRAKLTFPHAYLSKPFRIKDVLHAMHLALEIDELDSDDHSERYLSDRVFIRTNDHLQRVMYDQILFIEAEGAYTKIVTASKNYMLSQTLKIIESKIQFDQLLRVHRSFIINTQNVDRISEGFVYIGEQRIPVSRSRKEELYRVFNML